MVLDDDFLKNHNHHNYHEILLHGNYGGTGNCLLLPIIIIFNINK